jgi:cobalt-zinc-cadmium resistance protein CzcA
LAVVVIGGLVTATVLTLVLLPILYDRFRPAALRAARLGGATHGGGTGGCGMKPLRGPACA